jgi:hypothetical protein
MIKLYEERGEIAKVYKGLGNDQQRVMTKRMKDGQTSSALLLLALTMRIYNGM